MTSVRGSGRRCHLARAAVALASSLDFLQGTFEKIRLQGLLCQKLLQAMDFLAVTRCVRAGPRRFLSSLNYLIFTLFLVPNLSPVSLAAAARLPFAVAGCGN
jgi:hypothetical protein